jgi:hypothetical protein
LSRVFMEKMNYLRISKHDKAVLTESSFCIVLTKTCYLECTLWK